MEGAAPPITESGPSLDEKRASPRINFPAELVVVWRDAGGLAETLRVIDLGFGGMRLATGPGDAAQPTSVGRLGRAIHILPEHTQVDLDILVVWSVRRDDGGSEFGVRFLHG